jgi:Zn-dependent peptidase ImmA (M78 family)/DNA-binding XRE family transcriptional regulator
MFNQKRLGVARKRRQLTAKLLAVRADLSAITISRIENGENPDEETVIKIARALDYPISFFYGEDPEELDVNAVSFRSLTKMNAKEKDAAISAGTLGLELSNWIESQFTLPQSNIIDLSYETNPAIAAKSLREFWGLGEKPIGNIIGLLEVNGIRIFSLSENTASVDAFSFWKGKRPFVFLNNFKTAERSIFDTAHELGHLVLHRHDNGSKPSREVEREADLFASVFLMPENDVRARMPKFITVDSIIEAKKRWRVSAMAMAYRLQALGLLSEWQYKSACIELGRRGYRSGEPDGIVRETSKIWPKIFAHLWSERRTKSDIAKALNIPLDEIESLIWSLTDHPSIRPDQTTSRSSIHLVE